ncbi:MAG: DJ-1/PfpI family protein [Oscillospiraceae bacterium]|nr:DJ-1/PfpI family protein [Oscillospiraceae bacterium]
MVYVFLADGFEEVEAITIVDVLRRAKVEVLTVGVGSKTLVGAHNIVVQADIDICELAMDNNIEMIVLPGGMPGVYNLKKSKKVIEMLHYANNNGIYIAAICAAPTILGEQDMLYERQAVCFPGMEEELLGAKVVNSNVVVDGNIVTGKNMEAALEFANTLVGLLVKIK